MNMIINTKKEIPSEKETKKKILELSRVYNCEQKVRELYSKFEYQSGFYIYDVPGRVQLVKEFVYNLSNIEIALVLWMADDKGDIYINGELAFHVADVPGVK